METNYFGAIRCIQAVMRPMRERGSGAIINVTSVAGKVSVSPMGPYSASKFALEALRECQEISVSTSGQQTIVPVAMKLVSPQPEFGHLLVGNLQSRGISVGVELAFHHQASGGGSGGNKVDDDLMTD